MGSATSKSLPSALSADSSSTVEVGAGLGVDGSVGTGGADTDASDVGRALAVDDRLRSRQWWRR
ncbi:hypothetical protein, partial [Salinispora arenicola]|uniref:hypothetical protein n=1 Tax=Salinispora arenicola TaxID=168697 RepID=UPI0027DE24D1